MKSRAIRITALCITIAVFLGGALFLWRTGFFSSHSSVEEYQAYLERFSPFSEIIFFVVQLLSVIFAPIPNNIVAVAGSFLFGLLPAFLLSTAAITLGSFTVFILARILGKDFVARVVTKRNLEKYLDTIRRKRNTFLVLTFLFPFFPDDIICILAGLTDIKPLHFLVIVVLTRPWGILFACALGSTVFSVPLWGLIVIGIVFVAIFILAMKYGDRLEEKIMARLKKE